MTPNEQTSISLLSYAHDLFTSCCLLCFIIFKRYHDETYRLFSLAVVSSVALSQVA